MEHVKRISSKLTLLLTVVLPAVVVIIVGLSLMDAAIQARVGGGSVTMVVVTVVGLGWAIFWRRTYGGVVDEVGLSTDSLVVRNGHNDFVISLSQIQGIRESGSATVQRVTIMYEDGSPESKEVAFLMPIRLWRYPSNHEVVEELRARVRVAREKAIPGFYLR
jgi:hypothetical protein